MIHEEELQKIMPYAKRVDEWTPLLNSAMVEFHISDNPLREAAFIAQIAHESGQLRYTAEIASGSAYDNRCDLGNTDPTAKAIAAAHGQTTGQFFKGRGLIQTTGFYNYLKTANAFGIPVEQVGHWMETKEGAARSAAWWWETHGLNLLADRGDFVTITRRINGGTNGLQERIAYYTKAQDVMNV